MPRNYAIRASDKRRGKHRPRTRPFTIVERLLIEIEQRPEAKFVVGQLVQTPDGVKRIVNRYYSSSKRNWVYGFSAWRHRRTYDETRLSAIPDHLLSATIQLLQLTLRLA